jgi:hypothetical protein
MVLAGIRAMAHKCRARICLSANITSRILLPVSSRALRRHFLPHSKCFWSYVSDKRYLTDRRKVNPQVAPHAKLPNRDSSKF